MEMSSWDEWLSEQLDKLGLDAEVYQSYIEGIMGDEEGGEVEERVAAVLDLLGAECEEIIPTFAPELRDAWDAKTARCKESSAMGREEELVEYMQRLEADKRAAYEEQQRQSAELSQRQRDAGAVQERVALLEKYGFGSDMVDEEGNVVGGGGADDAGAGDASLAGLLGSNSNKTQVQEAQRLQRDKARAEHVAKVQKDKEMKLREQMKKEKEAKRTMKKEKQRGRG